jgi:hypothetical protein
MTIQENSGVLRRLNETSRDFSRIWGTSEESRIFGILSDTVGEFT